jgi:hypothetical protein
LLEGENKGVAEREATWYSRGGRGEGHDLLRRLDENASDTGTRRRRMNHLFVAASSALRRKLSEVPPMPGYWLLLARGAWIVVAGLSVGYCLANIPGAYARVQTICTQRMCPLFALTPSSVKELQVLGISMGFFAAYYITIAIVSLLVWFAVGAAIFRHKSDDRMALFVALALVTFGAVVTSQLSRYTCSASSALVAGAELLDVPGRDLHFPLFLSLS